MEQQRVEIMVPQRLRPQNKEGKDCDCMTREYFLKYKSGILHWCKAVGEPVAAGECVCEAEIEKKIFEGPAPVSGVLDECCVADDAEFQCRQVLGYVRCDA